MMYSFDFDNDVLYTLEPVYTDHICCTAKGDDYEEICRRYHIPNQDRGGDTRRGYCSGDTDCE